ncbi:hypothetical protein [Aurantivibrio infirmus]
MKFIEWNTPVGFIDNLLSQRTNYDSELGSIRIGLAEGIANIEAGGVETYGAPVEVSEKSKKWTVTCAHVVGFDFTEELCNIKFSTPSKDSNVNSRTFEVEQSDWIKRLEQESAIKTHYPNLKHYVIVTEFDVIQILTEHEPDFET